MPTGVFSQTRQLVKDGFLVEVSESSRKLRHVFLFTDLMLCAKMKKTSAGSVHQIVFFFTSVLKVPTENERCLVKKKKKRESDVGVCYVFV